MQNTLCLRHHQPACVQSKQQDDCRSLHTQGTMRMSSSVTWASLCSDLTVTNECICRMTTAPMRPAFGVCGIMCAQGNTCNARLGLPDACTMHDLPETASAVPKEMTFCRRYGRRNLLLWMSQRMTGMHASNSDDSWPATCRICLKRQTYIQKHTIQNTLICVSPHSRCKISLALLCRVGSSHVGSRPVTAALLSMLSAIKC